MNKDAVAETAKMIHADFPNVKCLPIVIDVTDEKSVNAMVDQAVQEFGTLDCGETAPHYSNCSSSNKKLTLLS